MKKVFFVLSVMFLALLTSVPCFAETNIINSVLISKSKEKANVYELSIDSTQTVQYKMYVEDENSVYFDLKNSKLSKNAGTIYDDVSDIDSVAVKQTDRNRVRIYIQGKNVRNTEISFVNSIFEVGENAKSVNINRPISEYQSTSYKDDLEDEEIQEWSDNSFNLSHLGLSIFKQLKKSHLGIVLIFLSMIGLIVFVLKVLTSKLSQEREPLIGLNNNFNALTDDMKQKTQKRSLALQRAQAQLASAHQNYQNYLNDKYKGNIPQKHTNTDAIAKSIGLNNYRKSTVNPYQNQEVIKLNNPMMDNEIKSNVNKDFTQKINSRDNFQIPPRPKMPVSNSIKLNKNEFTTTSIKKQPSKFDYIAPKKITKTNNMKFLESVTKIYEQSGRTDLATGLRNSMSKVNKV